MRDPIACRTIIKRAGLLATVGNLQDFYRQIPNGDRQFVNSGRGGAFGDVVAQSPAILARHAGIPYNAERGADLAPPV